MCLNCLDGKSCLQREKKSPSFRIKCTKQLYRRIDFVSISNTIHTIEQCKHRNVLLLWNCWSEIKWLRYLVQLCAGVWNKIPVEFVVVVVFLCILCILSFQFQFVCFICFFFRLFSVTHVSYHRFWAGETFNTLHNFVLPCAKDGKIHCALVDNFHSYHKVTTHLQLKTKRNNYICGGGGGGRLYNNVLFCFFLSHSSLPTFSCSIFFVTNIILFEIRIQF